MSLVFTSPGKAGDTLHQFPVAYHYCKEKRVRCQMWLDEKTGPLVANLLAAQPCVEAVKLIPGIKHYNCGGQPFDFGMENQVYLENEVYHLGLRAFPSRQLTLEALEQVPLHIDAASVASEPSIQAPNPWPKGDYVVLHGNFVTHTSGVPGFWRFLNWCRPSLPERRIFVGTPGERKRALEIYPGWEQFDDNGDFALLANVLAGAKFVLACGSSVAALAGQMKVPCVRVHDPIGEHPAVIWSNLGPLQWNLSERDLRYQWDKILADLALAESGFEVGVPQT